MNRQMMITQEFARILTRKRAAASKPLTFTFVNTVPENIVLDSAYTGPKTASLAEYDPGDGIWRTYTGKTIPMQGQYITFRGDWRNSAGIYQNMFNGTFGAAYPCTFDGSIFNVEKTVINTAVSGMFRSTFQNCSGLTGSIPANLFSGISVAPASYMFQNTFRGCSGLTGSIPEDLFSGISGEPAASMFNGTFYGCSNLTSIPEDLFSGISGAPAKSMFNRTFYDCKKLTGKSVHRTSDGKYLYEIFPTASGNQCEYCYRYCTKLEDYANIPAAWK